MQQEADSKAEAGFRRRSSILLKLGSSFAYVEGTKKDYYICPTEVTLYKYWPVITWTEVGCESPAAELQWYNPVSCDEADSTFSDEDEAEGEKDAESDVDNECLEKRGELKREKIATGTSSIGL